MAWRDVVVFVATALCCVCLETEMYVLNLLPFFIDIFTTGLLTTTTPQLKFLLLLAVDKLNTDQKRLLPEPQHAVFLSR